MTAAYVTAPGPAGAIRVGPLDVPRIGPDEVLVSVHTVAVDPVDTYVRSGRYSTPLPIPFVVGRDLVGRVAAVGSAVRSFAEGDRVWCNSMGHGGRQGSFAEYAAVPVERLYHLPDGVDPVLAVAVAHPAATAYLGWFVHADLRAGMTVLVGGGAGNVGTAATQIATRAGARVVATARQEDADRCRRSGAVAVVDYRSADLADQVLRHADGGVDIMWDTSGHNDLAVAAKVCRPGGRVLVTANDGDTPAPLSRLYQRDVSVVGFVISRARVEDLADAARLVNRMLVDGELSARIADELPLSETETAHRRMEAGGVSGRLLLHVG